jgi:hypothetical protein
MTPINYYRVSKVFLFISIAFLIVSLGSTISIIIAEFPVKLSPNSKGFENFVSYFSFPIKAFTATLATFAIWLTLERLSQTERQINEITDNNKFNNYYKHIEGFSRCISEEQLLKFLASTANQEMRSTIMIIHKHYYCDTYKDFVPRVRTEIRKQIQLFTDKLVSSPVVAEDVNLRTIPTTELEPIVALIDGGASTILESAMIELVKLATGGHASHLGSEHRRFELLSSLFLVNSFYMSLLAFDGNPMESSPFLGPRINQYYNDIGIKEDVRLTNVSS